MNIDLKNIDFVWFCITLTFYVKYVYIYGIYSITFYTHPRNTLQKRQQHLYVRSLWYPLKIAQLQIFGSLEKDDDSKLTILNLKLHFQLKQPVLAAQTYEFHLISQIWYLFDGNMN